MKRIIFILCAFFACLNTTIAQVKISCKDLDGTKWKVVEDYTDAFGIHYTGSPEGEYFEYTAERMIWHREDGQTSSCEYYITDNLPTEFEFNKVGSKEKGCYYIEYNPVLKTFKWWRFKTFDKNTKEMTLWRRPKSLNGFYVHYKLIGEASPSKRKPTYDTPLEQIHTKEYDVLQRETSTGGNTTTSGKTSTSGNSSTGKSTSTSGGSTTKAQTNKYIDPKDQLTPLKEWK